MRCDAATVCLLLSPQLRDWSRIVGFQAFKKNVKGCNGGENFDQDMLEEIYAAIKQDEIVMPAEQTGVVRENYLWKVTTLRITCRVSVLFLLLIISFINMHLHQKLMCIDAD